MKDLLFLFLTLTLSLPVYGSNNKKCSIFLNSQNPNFSYRNPTIKKGEAVTAMLKEYIEAQKTNDQLTMDRISSELINLPEGVFITFFVNIGNGGATYSGRILAFLGDSIVFKHERSLPGHPPLDIELKNISLDWPVSISNTTSDELVEAIAKRLEKAMTEPGFTTFYEKQREEPFRGKITRVGRNADGTPNGSLEVAIGKYGILSTSYRNIILGSIRNYVVTPPRLKPDEEDLLDLLQKVSRDQDFVSFLTNKSTGFWGGYITSIKLNEDGQWMIDFRGLTDEGRYKLFMLNLTDLVPESVSTDNAMAPPIEKITNNPGIAANDDKTKTLKPTSTNLGNITFVAVRSLIDQPGEVIDLPTPLLEQLAQFGSPDQAPFESIPQSLVDNVPKNHDLRLYFTKDDTIIRLTLRHSANGAWAISLASGVSSIYGESGAPTEIPKQVVNHLNGAHYYSLEELYELERQWQGNPSFEMRRRLIELHNDLMILTVESKFDIELSRWEKSIHEQIRRNDSVTYRLLLKH